MTTIHASCPRRSGRAVALCLSAMFVVAAIGRGDDAAAKLPVPNAADQKASQKLIDSIYGEKVRAAKTSADKVACSKTLLTVAGQEKDAATRYSLLNMSTDLAADGADLDAAFAALTEMDRCYVIDSLSLKARTLKTITKYAGAPASRQSAIKTAKSLFDDALAADRLEIARSVSEIVESISKKDSDLDTYSDYHKRLSDLAARESALKAMTEASAVLKSTPNDPAANLAVGRYDCFFKGEWKTGLPLLAKGNDAKLASTAKTELAGALTSLQKSALADFWFDYGKVHKSEVGLGPLEHAQALYEMVRAQPAGLSSLKAEQRIGEIAALLPARVIDLLKLVDPARDARVSGWHLENGQLFNDGNAGAELRFPYCPPAEYDLAIDYVREDGRWGDTLIVCHDGAVGAADLPTPWRATAALPVPVGQPAALFRSVPVNASGQCKFRMQFRRDELVAFFNGVKVIDRHVPNWKLGPRPNWLVPDPVALGVIVFYGKITIKSAEVTEISGPGTLLR